MLLQGHVLSSNGWYSWWNMLLQGPMLSFNGWSFWWKYAVAGAYAVIQWLVFLVEVCCGKGLCCRLMAGLSGRIMLWQGPMLSFNGWYSWWKYVVAGASADIQWLVFLVELCSSKGLYMLPSNG
ncbi:hypothetical protein ACOMHN_028285 [Nucella lapillus]